MRNQPLDPNEPSREITLVAIIDARRQLARWMDFAELAAVMRVRAHIHAKEDGVLVLDGERTVDAIRLIAPEGRVALVGEGIAAPPGVQAYATADALVAATEESLTVVGGPALYAAMLPHATQLDLVVLHDELDDPAGTFPAWREADWEVAIRTPAQTFDREIGTAYYMCLASDLAAMPELKAIWGSDDVAFPRPRGH